MSTSNTTVASESRRRFNTQRGHIKNFNKNNEVIIIYLANNGKLKYSEQFLHETHYL